MRIRAGFEISYDCPAPSPMIMMLSVHPSRETDLTTPDVLRADRPIGLHSYLDGFGNRCSRAVLPCGRTTLFSTFGGNPVSAAAALAVLDVITKFINTPDMAPEDAAQAMADGVASQQ